MIREGGASRASARRRVAPSRANSGTRARPRVARRGDKWRPSDYRGQNASVIKHNQSALGDM